MRSPGLVRLAAGVASLPLALEAGAGAEDAPPSAFPAGHPFLKGFRLLVGDGQGRLLWSSARRKMFLLSQPEDLRLADLGSSLDVMV
jgi:hypothetical protein